MQQVLVLKNSQVLEPIFSTKILAFFRVINLIKLQVRHSDDGHVKVIYLRTCFVLSSHHKFIHLILLSRVYFSITWILKKFNRSSFFVKSQIAVLNFCHFTSFSSAIIILLSVLLRSLKQLIFLSNHHGKVNWIIMFQKDIVCRGALDRMSLVKRTYGSF